LNLFETFYVSSFRQNLVSVSHLDKSGYHCSFENIKLVFSRTQILFVLVFLLIDNMYKLELSFYNEILQTSLRGTK